MLQDKVPDCDANHDNFAGSKDRAVTRDFTNLMQAMWSGSNTSTAPRDLKCVFALMRLSPFSLVAVYLND